MTDEKKPLAPSTIDALINDGEAPPAEEPARQFQVIDGEGDSDMQEMQAKIDRLADTMTPREKQWAGHYQAQVLGIGERLIKRELPRLIRDGEVSPRDASDPQALMRLGANLADGFVVKSNDHMIKLFGDDTTMAELVCICAYIIGRNMGINKSKGLAMGDNEKRELIELFATGVKMSEAYTAVMREQPQGVIQQP